MKTIKIENAVISKTRSKEIVSLYARIFKDRKFPETDQMKVYDDMRMVSGSQLVAEGSLQMKQEKVAGKKEY